MDILLVSITAGALATAGLMGILLARVLNEERRRSSARVEALRAASGAGARAAGGPGDLFVTPERPSPWAWRLAAAGVLSLLAGGAGFLMLGGGGPSDDEAPAARRAAPAALELLSLRHERQADTITITGLVQNPKNGTAISRVTATAFAFGPDGTFLASGRAPLDFSTLSPGDDSPFVIAVPVKGNVARYRIGFRDPEDRVIAHVDRRATDDVTAAR